MLAWTPIELTGLGRGRMRAAVPPYVAVCWVELGSGPHFLLRMAYPHDRLELQAGIITLAPKGCTENVLKDASTF